MSGSVLFMTNGGNWSMLNIKKKVLACLLTGILFMASFGSFVDFAQAKEPKTPELSLNESYEMASKNDVSLKSNDLSLRQNKYRLDEAMDDIDGTSYYSEALELSYFSANLDYANSKQAKENALALLEYQVVEGYYKLKVAIDNVDLTEKKMKKAMSDLKAAQAKMQVGLLSEAELTVFKNAYSSAKNNNKLALEELNSAYINFNSLVGLDSEDLPKLTDDISFEIFTVDNLQAEVSKAQDNSYDLAKAQNTKSLAEEKLRYILYDYKDSKYDVENVEYSIEQIKKNLEDTVLTMYSDIKALEEQYTLTEISISNAKENYRVTKVKYDAGMCTENDLIVAQTTLVTAENALVNIASGHELKVAYFKYLTGKNILNLDSDK